MHWDIHLHKHIRIHDLIGGQSPSQTWHAGPYFDTKYSHEIFVCWENELFTKRVLVNTVETTWPWVMNISAGILVYTYISRASNESCSGACHILERWRSMVFFARNQTEVWTRVQYREQDEGRARRRRGKKPTAWDIPYYVYRSGWLFARSSCLVKYRPWNGSISLVGRIAEKYRALAELYDTQDQRDVTVSAMDHEIFFISTCGESRRSSYKRVMQISPYANIYLQTGNPGSCSSKITNICCIMTPINFDNQ